MTNAERTIEVFMTGLVVSALAILSAVILFGPLWMYAKGMV
jgi:hypothetical protein